MKLNATNCNVFIVTVKLFKGYFVVTILPGVVEQNNSHSNYVAVFT